MTDRIIQEWYEKYGQDLYRHLCAKIRNPDEAQDIAQETFLKVVQRLNSVDREDVIRNPKAFLYRVAFNEFYNRHKRQKLQDHLLDIFGEDDCRNIEQMTPEHLALSKEELVVVASEIDKLPEKQRQAFLMTRVDHMSHSEAAGKLGVKVSTVKKHMVRVLATLRGARANYRTGKKLDEHDG